ncbi:MAG: DUF1360 domain-containing protein [Persicimonas sp.]
MNRADPADPGKPAWKTGERGREPLPLGGYAALIGLFGASVAGLMAWAEREERLLDEISAMDLLVLSVGSQKLARMATKDRISTVLRQPFTTYEGTETALPGETTESVRRDGSTLKQAVGELVVCPFCMSTWSATALMGTYLADRKFGRTLGAFLSVVSLAEVTQRAYAKLVG